MHEDTSSSLDRATVNGLVQLARDLAGTTDLPTMLSLVVTAITEVARFECAAINLVTETGDLQVVAVAGPPDLEEVLLGSVGSRAAWEVELAEGERHGAVHMNLDSVPDGEMPSWMSGDASWFARTAGDPRAWRREFAIYVPMADSAGELIGVVSVDMPASGLVPGDAQLAAVEVLARQAETAIASARALARTALDEHVYGSVFETAGAAMAIANRSGELTQTNRRFREQFDAVADADAFDRATSHVEGAHSLRAVIAEMFDGPVGERTFVVAAGASEDPRWYHVAVRGVAYTGADPVRAVCTMTDITAERRVRDQYQHDAEHDALTGLLNRRGLHHEAPAFLADRRAGEVVAVLFCDLDDFKQANDLRGHHQGDEVLIEVARCLAQAASEPALIARVGGDEFVVVTRCGSHAEAVALADDVVACVAVRLHEHDVVVTTSVGMAVEEAVGQRGISELMHAADEALYAAKQSDKGGWVLARP